MMSWRRTDTDASANGRSHAVIAFIDLAGFSAPTDIFGDDRAMAMLQVFEDIVHQSLDNVAPLKWIGDEVMLAFDDCPGALARLGALLTRCREEPRVPLTRTGFTKARSYAGAVTSSAELSMSRPA